MAALVVSSVSFVACQAPTPGKVAVDLTALSQAQTAGELRQVGLMVVGVPLASADAEVARVETDAGATESVEQVPRTEGTLVIGEAPRTSETETVPARQAEMQTISGGLAVPEVTRAETTERSDATAPTTPVVSYFPIALAAGQTEFSIEVPSGPSQSLFLYAFADRGGKEGLVPVYTAAAVGLDLKPAQEQQVRFAAYPAGVLAPQFLAPSLVGLTDETGAQLTAIPESLSCLAVARPVVPRSDYPRESVARVKVGSLVQTSTSATAASPGVFVLPAGKYTLECRAQFAGKLFGTDPNRPVIAEVKQGEVTVASASLVKLRDLVTVEASPLPGDGTALPPEGPNTGGPSAPVVGPPKLSVHLSPSTVTQVRQTQAGSGTFVGPVPNGSMEANFDNSSDLDVSVFARRDDGSVDTSFTGEVRVEIIPAIDPAKLGRDATGAKWAPFDAVDGVNGGGADSVSVFLINGAGVFSAVRTSALAISAMDREAATLQFLAIARPLDATGRAERAHGAKYFTVRRDLACRQVTLPFAAYRAWVPSARPNTLVARHDPRDNSYQPLTEHVFVAAVTADEGISSAASLCAFQPSLNSGEATVVAAPVDARSRAAYTVSGSFQRQQVGAPINDSVFVAKIPALARGQRMFFDALAPALPLTGSAGTVITDIGFALLDASQLSAPPYILNVDISIQ